jgi:hypothetical protein
LRGAARRAAHDAKGKVRFELGPARFQDLVAKRLCLPARLVHQRRLADPGPTLDDENPASAFQQAVNRRQLALALDQRLHEMTPRRAARTCSTHR